MKKLYPFFLICICFAGCSKDFLKQYDTRIKGSWQLVDIDRIGFGGSISNLPFTGGSFTFSDGGSLRYVDPSGEVYNGSWDIRKEWRRGNCSTDDDGDRNCDDKRVKTLHITAISFSGQDVRSEYFDEMVFTGTDRFKAYINSGFHTYVFRFRR